MGPLLFTTIWGDQPAGTERPVGVEQTPPASERSLSRILTPEKVQILGFSSWQGRLFSLGVQRPLNKWPFRKDHYFNRDL